jgi:O-antigen biosynthesis protein
LLDFHLLGYAYRDLKRHPNALLTVHGEYKEADLPAKLAALQADIVWFPAQWPETYSYTLSAALQAGLPLIAPEIGAFAERLQNRPWTWVQAWDTPVATWVTVFKALRDGHFATGTPPVVSTVLTVALPPAQVSPSPTAQATQQSDAAAVSRANWAYATHYLSGIGRRQPLVIASANGGHSAPLLNTQHAATEDDVTRQFKHRLLLGIIRLRSAPGLRGVARAIPLRWQTRLKTWLQA